MTPCATTAAPVETLREVVRRYGTPSYAYDIASIRTQVAKLRAQLPPAVEVFYSLKANASLGLSGVLADCGLGADVASAGELVTAVAAGFPRGRILVSGPDKSRAMLAQLQAVPEALLSLDSVSELQLFAGLDQPRRVLLRLRPDFCSFATCSAGPDSRFGLRFEDLPRCREYLTSRTVSVVGFHIFSGSQVLNADGIAQQIHGAIDLAQRAAEALGIAPEIIDLGGGFGIPYGPNDEELNLEPIAGELRWQQERLSHVRLMFELGRYLVAPSGWYLTSVVAHQHHRGRRAVVVDGGVHQRGDMCGLGLRQKGFPPVVLREQTGGALTPTDVLGCLSLPSDVLIESSPLPPLSPGDVLAFPNAGAYGLTASPCLFHGHVPPAEVAFEGTRLELIRSPQPVQRVLEGQSLLSESRG